jgi:hypothetical protein
MTYNIMYEYMHILGKDQSWKLAYPWPQMFIISYSKNIQMSPLAIWKYTIIFNVFDSSHSTEQ